MVGKLVVELSFQPLHSREILVEEATRRIASHLRDEITSTGHASLFLSGGSTPGPIYSSLSKILLPWEKVTIGLVDERWVDEDDAGSNAALIRRTLLTDAAKKANFIPMKNDFPSPQAGQYAAESAYKAILTKKSMAVLGMGTDGHVCSWFPEADGLPQALDKNRQETVQAITAKQSKVTGQYLDRMTLTYSALKSCKEVLLLITGDEKRAVLEKAFQTHNSSLPVAQLIGLEQSRLTILHAS